MSKWKPIETAPCKEERTAVANKWQLRVCRILDGLL